MSTDVRYRITHLTRYRYSEPVAICQNQLRMLPRDFDSPCLQVRCLRSKATVRPEPEQVVEHCDYYGNRVLSFSIESHHQSLEVSVQSEVTVHSQLDSLEDVKGDADSRSSRPDRITWDQVLSSVHAREDRGWFEAQEFQFDSPRVRRGEAFAEYARPSFPSGRSLIGAALDLTKRIHRDFKYDVSATDVNTTPEEAFKLRAGVCQDFAHVQLACLRSLGLPARYVSGYLRTVAPPGKERLVGADQSHAWVSLYAGEGLGWIDLDPTNACLANGNHVPICVGRDYGEVSPMRGVVLGGGETDLHVSVDVDPIS